MVVAGLGCRRGFSLAEVLLALALITIVVLTLLGLSIQSLSASQKTRDLTAGQLAAEQVVERLVYEGDTTGPLSPFWTQNSALAPYNQQNVTISNTVFNVTTYLNDVVDSPGLFVGQKKRLKRLNSTVIWQDAQQGKANQGRLQLQTTRLVHEP